jgi:hypothetical protein
MKMRSAAVRGCLLGLAVSAAQLIAGHGPALAECARNGWCYVGVTNTSGCDVWMRYLRRDRELIAVEQKDSCSQGSIGAAIDCNAMQYAYEGDLGRWRDILPASVMDATAKAYC